MSEDTHALVTKDFFERIHTFSKSFIMGHVKKWKNQRFFYIPPSTDLYEQCLKKEGLDPIAIAANAIFTGVVMKHPGGSFMGHEKSVMFLVRDVVTWWLDKEGTWHQWTLFRRCMNRRHFAAYKAEELLVAGIKFRDSPLAAGLMNQAGLKQRSRGSPKRVASIGFLPKQEPSVPQS